MRVACFSPLPPERSGIADYTFELLEELRHLVDVVAVVSDTAIDRARVPDGVELVANSTADSLVVDCNLYQMGNNSKFHRFFFQRAFDEPGLLVMHDPSLADITAELCGRAESTIFRQEIAYDCPDIQPSDDLPLVDVGNGRKDLDRLRVLLARRILESNVRTLVHSAAMAREMRRRYPTSDVQSIQLPAPVLEQPAWASAHRPGEIVFGVFGGINYYKRVRPLVDAFLEVRSQHPLARMVIAGRADDHLLERELRAIAAQPELDGALEVKTNLTLAELEHEMLACHVGISLRWPTAGEMSATLMRTFGAGRPAVVSDVLQFRELDERFCWRVTTDFAAEHGALVELMESLARDPERCRSAGALARSFVERHGTYEVVAHEYLDHLEHCAANRTRKASSRQHLRLRASLLGVNVITPFGENETARAAQRVIGGLRDAGLDVAVLEVQSGPVAAIEEADRRPRPVATARDRNRVALAPGTVTRSDADELAAALQALDPRDRELVGRGPHPIDLYFTEHSDADRLGRLARVRRHRGHRIVPVVAEGVLPLSSGFRMLIEFAEALIAPSAHSAEIAGLSTLERVEVIGWPIARPMPTASPPSGRSDGMCRFVGVVDAGKPVALADPWSTVAAFRQAFTPAQRGVEASLTIVLGDSSVRPEARDRLQAALRELAGELVIDPSPQTFSDVVATGDVFVSLHRAEGFGLRLADAMANGMAVIATAYSGNRHYMDDSVAGLVGYQMTEVTAADFYLDPTWVEPADRGRFAAVPDIAAAARWMRRLAADAVLRSKLAAAAASRVRGELDSERIAAELITFLNAIERQPKRTLVQDAATRA